MASLTTSLALPGSTAAACRCKLTSSLTSSLTPTSPLRATFASVPQSRRMTSAAVVRSMAEEAEASAATVDATSAPATSAPTISPPAGFSPPEPKRLSVAEGQLGTILSASIGLPLRGGLGVFVQGYSASLEPEATADKTKYSFGSFAGRRLVETSKVGPRPEQPIILYEFEGCPFCRKVREMVSYLDLDVLFYPCPQGGPNFRPKAIAEGGKKQFPYLIDPNTGVSMYESDDIIKYLAEKYGDGTVPLALRLGAATAITAGLAGIGRFGKGSRYVPAISPPKPLEVWAYEPSPFCKIVKEALNELELPHLYHSCARGSAKRQELFERVGRFQAPYLEDQNTGVAMFESKAIVEYLYATYAKEKEIPATAAA